MQRRRLQMAAAAFLVATGGFGVGAAHADDNASQICKSIVVPVISHGACVSLAQAGNTTALISSLCGEPGFPEAVRTTNRGQCIKVLRAALP